MALLVTSMARISRVWASMPRWTNMAPRMPTSWNRAIDESVGAVLSWRLHNLASLAVMAFSFATTNCRVFLTFRFGGLVCRVIFLYESRIGGVGITAKNGLDEFSANLDVDYP